MLTEQICHSGNDRNFAVFIVFCIIYDFIHIPSIEKCLNIFEVQIYMLKLNSSYVFLYILFRLEEYYIFNKSKPSYQRNNFSKVRTTNPLQFVFRKCWQKVVNFQQIWRDYSGLRLVGKFVRKSHL